MTRARNVLVADRCTWPISSPIGVNGPTRKISRRPITSGGSSRPHSSPASHTRWNGSLPWASIHASGVQTRNSTPRVMAPDSIETTSGPSAPGARSAVQTERADRCASRAITGPISAIQTTAAPATDAAPYTERTVPVPAGPRPAGPCAPDGPGWTGGSVPWTVPAAADGLGAQLTLYRPGDRAAVAGHGRREHGVSALLVLGQARGGQRVPDERGPGRGRLADQRDVDDLRRPLLHLAAGERDGRLLVLRGVREVAQVDRVGQLDVVEVELDRLGDVRAGRVQLARLERRVERGLGVDLRRIGRAQVRGAQDPADRVRGQLVLGLGQFQHLDEVGALRVDVRVGPAELEAGLLHQREQAGHRLLAVGDGLELAGVFALGVVGHHDRGARVLDVPLGECGLQWGDVVTADALEDVRADLPRGDLGLQRAGRLAPAGELVALGRGEGGRDDLLVEVLEGRRVRDVDRPRRLGAAGRARARGAARGGRRTAACRQSGAETRYSRQRREACAGFPLMIRHLPDNSQCCLRGARML